MNEYRTAQTQTAARSGFTPVGGNLLQRACACGRHTGGGGECESCKQKRQALQRSAVRQTGPDVAPPIVHEVLRSPGRPLDEGTRAAMESRFESMSGKPPIQDFSRVSVVRASPAPFQAQKLVVNQPGDRFEREAERMAGRVAASPSQLDHAAARGSAGPLFENVRIHTDAQASKSAQAVNAQAYTVGQRIVFGDGQFAPETPAGRRLLAHELAHTVQQSEGADTLHRFVSCSVVTMSGEDCPAREPDEVRNSRDTAMVVLAYDGYPLIGQSDSGQLVANFAVGQSSLQPGLERDFYWNGFVSDVTAHPEVRWEILGFSDCQGELSTNQRLREERAAQLYNALPEAAQRQIVEHKAAPIGDCIADNADRGGRSLNRSALVRRVSTEYEFEEEEEEPIEVEIPRFICGPDVTEEVASTIGRLRATFAGFTPEQQEESCDALVSYPVGLVAWDIVDLCDKCRNGNIWISRDFRPTCATVGATPPCGPTVQVGGECFFSGSANYVIYGVMFKLCSAIDPSEYNETEMLEWIEFYKTKGGLQSATGNLATAQAWAQAGYSGWSGGSAPVSGDRSDCRTLCPLPYSGSAFRVRWCPELDPDGLCASSR